MYKQRCILIEDCVVGILQEVELIILFQRRNVIVQKQVLLDVAVLTYEIPKN